MRRTTMHVHLLIDLQQSNIKHQTFAKFVRWWEFAQTRKLWRTPANPKWEFTKPNKMYKYVGSPSRIQPNRLHLTTKRHPWDVIQWCSSIVWSPNTYYSNSTAYRTLSYVNVKTSLTWPICNTLIYLYQGVQYTTQALLQMYVL